MTINEVSDATTTATLLALPLNRWKDMLAEDCQVYACDGGYLAKCFDEINFRFCSVNEAKTILTDNLYALLRFKYFPTMTDEIMERIQKIVNAFCMNLKSTLLRVTFDKSLPYKYVHYLPDGCVAFRNGVYDFHHNSWLFKYDVIEASSIGNKLYSYDPTYIITWYMNYDFTPLDIDIASMSIQNFVDMMKEYCKTERNYCFELCYNISHDVDNEFSLERFTHLCEILGYATLQSFSQNFVLLVGSGQNGKNSLFDGCFTNRLYPRPASIDLDTIETDRFVTGSLENHAHNIFLETSAKTYTESKMIKALTGSMYQTVECKGVSKYSSIINCKYIFAGNDQDSIKFTDETTGFKRRINIFEIFFRWDKDKRFLKAGDYYDTTFSSSLKELTSDITNNTIFIYLAMLGICSGTRHFERNFHFSYNDWKQSYTSVGSEFEKMLTSINCFSLAKIAIATPKADLKTCFFDSSFKKIFDYIREPDLAKYFADDENAFNTFCDDDLYISVKFIQEKFMPTMTTTAFTRNLKKYLGINTFPYSYGNRPYIKMKIEAGRSYFILK